MYSKRALAFFVFKFIPDYFLRAVWRTSFHWPALKLYRLYFPLKHLLINVFKPAKNKIIYPLTTRYAIHGLVILAAILVTTNSIKARGLDQEEIGKNSILSEFIGPDQEIVEKSTTPIARTKTYQETIGSVAVAPTMEGEEEAEPTMTSETGAALIKPNLIEPSSEGPRSEVVYYTVTEGDTVSTIAEKFGISTNTILWENRLSATSLIKPGEQLTILPVSGVSHQVKSSETLSGIAKKYGVSEEEVLNYNQLASAGMIEKDEILIIPGGEITAPTPTPSKRSGLAILTEILTGKPPSAAVPAGEKLLWPTLSHKINQYFTWRHSGIDIDGNYSSPIYAADDGRVEAVGWGSGYGLRIIINHGGSKETLYGHLSKSFVKEGQRVSKGETVAMMGCTGWCTGTHVHFEVFISGRKVNPLKYL